MKEAIARTDKMTQAEWLVLRQKGIGGSDAAVACGLSKWKSPLSLWLEKTGKQEPKPAGESAYWGTVMEPILQTEFAKRTGLTVEPIPYMFRSKDHPFMLANIDGIVRDGNDVALLEIKTAGLYAAAEWTDGLPAEYFIQIQHYLSVCGLSKAYIAVLIGGNTFQYHKIQRDVAAIKNIIAIESKFWQMVTNEVQPPVDGSGATADALASMYPNSNKISLILPDTADEILRRYFAAKEFEAKAKAEKILCENQLKDLIKDAECAKTLAGHSVSWKSVTTNRIDSTKLKTEQPELVKQYLTASSSRKFTVAAAKAVK